MRIIIIILQILLVIIIANANPLPDSVTSDILLRTFIEQDNVPLNREVVYHVELRWQGDLNNYQIKKIEEPALTNLTIRGSGSSNKVNTSPDGTLFSIKRITFYLIPDEIGMSYIDGMTIRYTESSSGQEASLISSRIGVKINDPLPDPGSSPVTTILIWGTIVIILIAGGVYFLLKYQKRRDAQRLLAQSENLETVEEKYLRLLRETIQFETENIKESMSDLSHLLTGYFTEKFNLPAGGISTKNLLEILADKSLSAENLARIKDFYPRADMVKFAAEKVDISEFHRLYDTVELVIENQSKGKIDES